MQHFLFVVDMPEPGISSQDPNAASRWFDFAKVADAIQLPHGSQKLPCKNSWLFPAEGSAQPLRELANSADAQKLGHSTFLISGEITPLTSQPQKPLQQVRISGL